MSDVQYLIFDVEAVGDGDLIQRVRYPDRDMTPLEAITQYQADLLEQTGRDVIPPTFVEPVSVAVAKVSRDYRLMELTVLDSPHFRPEHIIRRFWQGWMHYDRPTLVTFNGRGYDVPVLEFGAFRYGISLPAWFNVESRSFEQARNRYNIDRHIDLQDLFSNFSAVRVNGGLNLMSNLIFKPGKSGIDGSQVQGLYFDGEVQKINDYCRCDVLDTYFVFLRSRVLIGRLSLDEEQVLIDDVRQLLESEADQQPAYEHYLEFWDRRLEQQRSLAERQQRAAEEKEAALAAMEAEAASRESTASDSPDNVADDPMAPKDDSPQTSAEVAAASQATPSPTDSDPGYSEIR